MQYGSSSAPGRSLANSTAPLLVESFQMFTLLRSSALLLCLLPFAAFAQQGGYQVVYEAGSVPGFHAGDEFRLSADSKDIRLSKEEKKDVLVIPAASVDELSYGNSVVRRVKATDANKIPLKNPLPAGPDKAAKPRVGITWVDGDRKGSLAIQCGKDDHRAILSALEASTGKKAIDSDAR